jgi:hypothetical protein
MGVRQESKHELAQGWRDRYWKAGRQEKGRLLDEFASLTGYHRKYAMALLRHGPAGSGPSSGRRGRPIIYGPAVLAALEVAAEAAGWICGKRLAPFMEELVPALEQEGALEMSEEVRGKLLAMKAATIDRRLRTAKARQKPRGLATTRPGSLLKRQVPVRTYTPWDEQSPGFLEIDTVAHCGTSTEGEYVCTLSATDLATGWTECQAVMGKTQRAVHGALMEIRERLPFPLLGIDFDNGAEFLNGHLIRYCQAQEITYTRCRAYHKNDQAHIEQKNWSVVRSYVGYDRYESASALVQLRRTYELLRLYVNLYQPVMKLVGKEREGPRVRKRYDEARTPFRRAVEAGVITRERRAELDRLMAENGPLTLKRRIDVELDKLWRLRVGGQMAALIG